VKTLNDIGEREAIRIIKSILSKGLESIGIGDDCAAFDIDGRYLLVSTDMITASTHIPNSMNPWEIGWFITAINFSDIAAKGGRILGMVLSLGLPVDTSEDFLVSIIKGADSCARRYKTSIVGGDTKENKELTLSGTVFGLVPKEQFMSRKGAKVGDIIAVTGSLGKAAAGFLAMQKGCSRDFTRDLFQPTPRVSEGIRLGELKVIHASMDISDGLSSSLYQLGEVNNVGFEIWLDSIPISNRLIEVCDSQECIDNSVLHFGGDYELLLILPEDKFLEVKHELDLLGTNITKIGRVRRDLEILLKDRNGVYTVLPDLGYEHFKHR